jgi:hypothetical protein
MMGDDVRRNATTNKQTSNIYRATQGGKETSKLRRHVASNHMLSCNCHKRILQEVHTMYETPQVPYTVQDQALVTVTTRPQSSSGGCRQQSDRTSRLTSCCAQPSNSCQTALRQTAAAGRQADPTPSHAPAATAADFISQTV